MPFAVLLAVAGCARHPVPIPTPSLGSATEAVACASPNNSSARPSGFRPAVSPRMLAGLRRIDSLSSLVDSIVVRPDSLVLHLGESVDFYRLAAIGYRRSSGEVVPTAASWIAVQDLAVVQFRDAGLTGLTVGRTQVVVTVYSNTPGFPTHAPPTCILVRVIP